MGDDRSERPRISLMEEFVNDGRLGIVAYSDDGRIFRLVMQETEPVFIEIKVEAFPMADAKGAR